MYNNTIVNKKNFYANKEGGYDYDDDGDNNSNKFKVVLFLYIY